MGAYGGSDADFITRQFILNENTPTLITETYKNIRTHLLFAMKESGFPCAAITSQCKSEGKTTTAANLAITLSMLEKRVLLIDADLRRPSLDGLFRLKSRYGLSSVLSGQCDVYRAISQDVLRNFHVMPAGAVPENPADLLGGANMERLIRLLYEFYDFILIDTPPLCVANDSLLFGGYTAGVVLVVRENRTTHTDLKKALLTVSLARANLIGAVKTYCAAVKDEISDYKSLLRSAEEDGGDWEEREERP